MYYFILPQVLPDVCTWPYLLQYPSASGYCRTAITQFINNGSHPITLTLFYLNIKFSLLVLRVLELMAAVAWIIHWQSTYSWTPKCHNVKTTLPCFSRGVQ